MTIVKFKQELLDALYAPYKKCTECPLGMLGRKNVVFGEGNPNAALMLIGEGPGKDEDEQGRPFVGRSGKLLTRALELAGISREEVFITNIVKCRPPNNRAPKPEEAGTCKGLFLFNQIKIIRPQIICTLGSVALHELLDPSYKITKVRGKRLTHGEITVLPTYHPAYVLRNPAAANDFLDDIIQAVKAIDKKSN